MCTHLLDMSSVRDTELFVLYGNNTKGSHGNEESTELIKYFFQGKYEDVLRHSIGEKLLKGAQSTNDSMSTSSSLASAMADNVDRFLLSSQHDRDILELEVLLVGASCLQLFVQNNYTGPLTETAAIDVLSPRLCRSPGMLIASIHEDLGLDGAPVYTLARHIVYLYLARVIFLDCRNHFKHLQTADWWLMRVICVHQEILEEKSPTLKSLVLEIMDNISKREPLITSEDNRDIAILFYLEAGHLCHTFYEYKRAVEYFKTVRKMSGLKVQLTGAMGKRTKFQQDAKAQLMLKVEPCLEEGEFRTGKYESKTEKHPLPKSVALEDDTVLDGVKLTNDDTEFCVSLSQLDQAIIYGIMDDYKRSMAMERLTEEEVLTYALGILDNVSNWCLATSCLALRSKLQWESRRRVERSMNQYEELVNQIGRPSPEVCHRLVLFYASKISPIWDLQRSLATLLLSLGLTGEGLLIYERLHMWDEAIACYQRMGKIEKAENVIREHLAVKETPNLYCFLGDVTRDVAHYQKAWEMSKKQSARAMRCMAYLYFGRQEYELALECFEKSLNVNSLQIPVWFTYGCTAMTLEKYEIACNAFRRCVMIEADNFEAWGNLSTCLVKLKKLPAAFKVLKDAIKYNYESWRLWDNLLTIATDCGEFEEVIQAYHRLIDIKNKWTDAQVLGIVVRAVTDNIPDAAGRPSSRLRPKLQELLGRVTSTVTNEAEIWKQYAKLISSVENPDHSTMEKALQHLQRAHRCVMQTPAWEKDIDKCVTVAEDANNLALEYLKFADKCESAQAITSLSSGKLMLRSVIAKIKQENTDPVTQTLAEKLQSPCCNLTNSLEKIVKRIDDIKGT